MFQPIFQPAEEVVGPWVTVFHAEAVTTILIDVGFEGNVGLVEGIEEEECIGDGDRGVFPCVPDETGGSVFVDMEFCG
jgi:hypothetical protein